MPRIYFFIYLVLGGVGDEWHSMKSGRKIQQVLPFFDSPIVYGMKGERS